MSGLLRAAAAAATGVGVAFGAHTVADAARDAPQPAVQPVQRAIDRPAPPRFPVATELSRRIDELERAVADAEAVLAASPPQARASTPPARSDAVERDEAVRLARVERDFPSALRAWQEIVRRDPSSSDAWAAIGDLERRMGDASGAEAAFRKVLDLAARGSAQRRRAAIETAMLAERRGAHDEARRLAEDVAAEEGVDVETWGAAKCLVASVARETGDVIRARAEWESVVAAAGSEPRLRAAALKARRGIDSLGRVR